jgi:phospholipid/cholesterol/gamma-HCH transport system permease protein
VRSVADLEPAVEQAARQSAGAAVIDISGVTHLDTAGAWLFHRLAAGLAAQGASVSFAGLSDNTRRLLTAVAREATIVEAEHTHRVRPPFALRALIRIGESIYDVWSDFWIGINLLGDAMRGIGLSVAQPWRLRFTSIIAHLDRTSLQAVPIVFLISFLIGAIIAQQGAFLLRSFGADFLIVDLVGILVLREIGVLITAIMVAGRSGSAYTRRARLVKMREVDALKVIGLDAGQSAGAAAAGGAGDRDAAAHLHRRHIGAARLGAIVTSFYVDSRSRHSSIACATRSASIPSMSG